MAEIETVDDKVYVSQDFLIKTMVARSIEYSDLNDMVVDEFESQRVEAYQHLLKDLKKQMPLAERLFCKEYLNQRFAKITEGL